MKKISLIILCAMSAVFFVSCQTGDPKDSNGDTPSSVVEKMYQAIQNNQFEEAASYCKVPEKVDNMDSYNAGKQGSAWKDIVISTMVEQSKVSNYVLKNYEVVSEEISNTDPNSAKVKTKITYSKNGVDGEAECSFPLKRENDIWLIIG
ncbi:MAG: hypothetical protein IKX35_10075 [Bacteroidales bacterium]|nr:hypothetical protein [Bacteroidales bacterium]